MDSVALTEHTCLKQTWEVSRAAFLKASIFPIVIKPINNSGDEDDMITANIHWTSMHTLMLRDLWPIPYQMFLTSFEVGIFITPLKEEDTERLGTAKVSNRATTQA